MSTRIFRNMETLKHRNLEKLTQIPPNRFVSKDGGTDMQNDPFTLLLISSLSCCLKSN